MSDERRTIEDRLFPPADASLYEVSPPEFAARPQAFGRRFLGLAKGPWAPGAPIRRMLDLHRQAVRAELASRWDAADFFWREFGQALDAVWARNDAWDGAARTAGAAAEHVPAGSGVRDRFLDEVVLDAHRAFYEGLRAGTERSSLADRAFVHVAAVQTHLARSARPLAERQQAFGPMLEARVVAARGAKDPRAVAWATELLERFPQESRYLQLVVECEIDDALAGLTNREDKQSALADTRHLRQGIERLEDLRTRHPRCASIFDALGLLHRVRAVKFANGAALADAIGEAERAAAFAPDSDEVEKTRQQLCTMMENLQAQMRHVASELATRENARLSEDGMHLARETERGFGEALAFHESGLSASVTEALAAARARWLWEQIGLAEPHDRWDERAAALRHALAQVFGGAPADDVAVATAWAVQVASEPELGEIDEARVRAFVRRRLLGEGRDGDTPPGPTSPDAPVTIRPVSRERRPGREPFGYWLRAPRDVALKIGAAATAAVLVTATGLSTANAWHDRSAEVAWRQLAEARTRDDRVGVIKAAEAFFATPARARRDADRNAEAYAVYSEALVRWFIDLPDAPNPATDRHLQAYHHVADARAKGETR